MTHVAIVGCGVVGAAIAYELSKIEGLSVTLIDANQPASGASGAALGIMMAVISHKFKGRSWQLRYSSLQRYDSLISELETLTKINIPYNRQGILKLTSETTDLEKWQKLQKIRLDQGLNLEIWSLEKLKNLCPYLDLEQNQIKGALYSPSDRQVNPTILTQALVAASVKQGVNCQFGVKVEEIISTQLRTNQGDFSADWIVIAAGIGSNPLMKSIKISPVLGQAIQIKLDANLGHSSFQPIITFDDVHLVPLGNSEYWIGATVEFTEDNQELSPDNYLLEIVKNRAIAFCPALAGGKIINNWFGLRPRPEGQPAPILQPLFGNNQVIVATGHYRNGVLLAPATAEAVKELLGVN